MTPTRSCPKCHATYRVTDLHWCRGEPQRPSPKPARLPLWVELVVVGVVGLGVGWAVWGWVL